MEIAKWLEKEKISLRKLGEKARISQGTLYAAFSSGRGLSLRTAQAVSKATKGAVSVEEAMSPPKHRFADWRKRPKLKRCRFCGK